MFAPFFRQTEIRLKTSMCTRCATLLKPWRIMYVIGRKQELRERRVKIVTEECHLIDGSSIISNGCRAMIVLSTIRPSPLLSSCGRAVLAVLVETGRPPGLADVKRISASRRYLRIKWKQDFGPLISCYQPVRANKLSAQCSSRAFEPQVPAPRIGCGA